MSRACFSFVVWLDGRIYPQIHIFRVWHPVRLLNIQPWEFLKQHCDIRELFYLFHRWIVTFTKQFFQLKKPRSNFEGVFVLRGLAYQEIWPSDPYCQSVVSNPSIGF